MDALTPPTIALLGVGPEFVRAREVLEGEGLQVVTQLGMVGAPPSLLVAAAASVRGDSGLLDIVSALSIPTLVLGPDFEGVPISDATDGVPSTFEPGDLVQRCLALLARAGYLHLVIRRYDASAILLARTATVEWVRARTGIIGLLRIPRRQTAPELRLTLDRVIGAAHSALDDLSEERLSSDDLWNLLLLVSLPWTHEEAAAETALMTTLSDLERSLTGSRKVCVWRTISPLSHFSGFAAATSAWLPSSTSPLHDELRAVVKDHAEYDALLALFKRRLLDGDVDNILKTLSRELSQ
jgi:hypothetical protein